MNDGAIILPVLRTPKTSHISCWACSSRKIQRNFRLTSANSADPLGGNTLYLSERCASCDTALRSWRLSTDSWCDLWRSGREAEKALESWLRGVIHPNLGPYEE